MDKKKINAPEDYFDNYYDWPSDWMGVEEDIIIGNSLLTIFTPFVETLIEEKHSVKTIKKHLGNLALLGGEIIGRLNDEDEKNRKLTPRKLLLEYIDDECGPLVDHWDPNNKTEEALQKAFDGTCRKLHKFILTSK